MSGLAIVLGGCDFSAKNLGKVTFLEDSALAGLNIIGPDKTEGKTATYLVSYLPVNSSQRGVKWSIIAGNAYADIDAVTGILTIKSNTVVSQNITIQATSIVSPSIVATKVVSIKYAESVDILNSITISCKDTMMGDRIQLGITYNPANTALTGVTWAITNGGDYASVDAVTGMMSIKGVANSNAVTLEATSIHNAEIKATKTVTVTYSDVFWSLKGNVGYVPLPSMDITKASVLVESAIPLSGLATNYANFLFCTQDMAVSSAERGEIAIASTYQNVKCVLASESAGVGSGWTAKTGLKTFDKKDIKIILMNPDYVYTGNDMDSLSENGWNVSPDSKGQAKFIQFVQFGTKNGGGNAYDYKSNAALSAAVQNGDVKTGDDFNVRIKTFILFSNTKYNTAAEMIANRRNADIDIQFDATGAPFNAGKSGTLIYSGY